MAVQNPSRGFTSSARISSHPGAYAEILSTDFGVGGSGGTAPALTPSASGGSLATTTARVAVAWITASGLTQVSLEATAAVTGPTGSVSVVKPTTPTVGANAQPILGWTIFSSSGGAGTPLLNVAGTNPASVPFVTTHGTIQGFALTTTPVVIQIYGTGQAEPTTDQSGNQDVLPTIAANTTVDYYFRIPNTGSQWKVQKSVEWMRPQGVAEPGGTLVGPMDCISPLYPGTGQVVTASQATPVYFVMNGFLFKAITSGTTAATFIGFSNFNTNRYGTTTDGTVVWMCFGREVLVRCHFGNNSASPVTPVAQEYDLFEV